MLRVNCNELKWRSEIYLFLLYPSEIFSNVTDYRKLLFVIMKSTLDYYEKYAKLLI